MYSSVGLFRIIRLYFFWEWEVQGKDLVWSNNGLFVCVQKLLRVRCNPPLCALLHISMGPRQ